ncbi:MAG: DUF3383 family protein [Paraclostridium sp.]
MGRIVNAVVIDLTRPVIQKGFKSVALFDFTQDVATSVITDTSTLTAGTKMMDVATAFFANGGSSLVISGKNATTASDVMTHLQAVSEEQDFYGVLAVIPKANQTDYFSQVQQFVEGNEKLSVLEVNGTKDEVELVLANSNSDRVVPFSNSKDEVTGLAGAVAGVCFPQEEGSITWGNKVVTGVPTSGYSVADERALMAKNINYITKEMGLVITQFGRTTSGSNADITRSKDYLKNRLMESLTSALVNSKKVPYTTQGMAIISSAMNEVGVQALNQGMLTEFRVITPKIEDIPTNDKANRVLNGVKFIATLSGAVETINLEITVKL